ncbi:MAG: hypothetical protein HZC01_01360 [Candidatus Kerfeldbacteria bacterium]|nr:hypothetical protein [Candidatus Kerfeldbacteria bacterium]
MHYLQTDLERIWRETKKRLKKNPLYLKQLERRSNRIMQKHEIFNRRISLKYLRTITDTQLLAQLKRVAGSLTDAVGIAHILESISIGIEREFKQAITRVVPPNDVNKVFMELATPTQLSFVTQEERALFRIKKDSGWRQAIARHAKRYSWIQNSYSGPVLPAVQWFMKRWRIAPERYRSLAEIRHTKNQLMRRYYLGPEIQTMVSVIDQAAIWQDNRKQHILRTIGYVGLVIHEIHRRVSIDERYLYQLGVREVLELRAIRELKRIRGVLIERYRSGCFVVTEGLQEYIASGPQYRQLNQRYQHAATTTTSNDLHGSSATMGTAIGRAVICRNLASLKNVRRGDIIIASMTRPEYMPALRKAVGIVTDEGGITCHAAIVSRELGIPCIVGTQYATKVFKDGDMIEVRANHGIVRKI